MAKLNMVKALNLALLQEMERDEDVLVIGEDVGVDGGVFRVTEDLHRKFGSKRVIDSPLAEAAIIGTGRSGAGTAVAQAHLRSILGYLGMTVMGAPETCVPWRDGVLSDPTTLG